LLEGGKMPSEGAEERNRKLRIQLSDALDLMGKNVKQRGEGTRLGGETYEGDRRKTTVLGKGNLHIYHKAGADRIKRIRESGRRKG